MSAFELDWLGGRARLTPTKTAVIEAESEKSRTFKELNEVACLLAARMKRDGVNKGDRVALLAPNNMACVDYMMACAKLGAIFVPLNFRLSVQELKYIMDDCTPSLLVYDPSFETLAKPLVSDTRLKLTYDPLASEDAVDPGLASDAAAFAASGPHMDDPWMIIYTGGTTGRSKGVVLSHRAVWGNAVNTIVSWGLGPDEVTINGMPMFHTGGINVLTIPVLLAGGTVVLTKEFHPERTWKLLQQYRCTIVLMVPTMYHRVMQQETFWSVDFDPVPVFISGGAPCPHTIYEGFSRRGLPFKEGYGLTEGGPNNFFITLEDAAERRGSVGKPMQFGQVMLAGPDGKETAADEVGELWVRGLHLFDRYWNNETATAEALHEGWLHTGDLGKRDKDGFYYIVGRKKDMIISGGENIYPREIEQLLDAIPEIHEAAVVGIEDEAWGEIAVAAICLKPGTDLEAEAIQEHCRERLARYKVPKRIVFWESLPKTDVGKIDKKEMKRRLQ